MTHRRGGSIDTRIWWDGHTCIIMVLLFLFLTTCTSKNNTDSSTIKLFVGKEGKKRYPKVMKDGCECEVTTTIDQ